MTRCSDREVEEALLTALLTAPEHLPEVAGWLQPEMFSDPGLGFVYQAIQVLYNKGEMPDYLTTETEMRRMDAGRCDEMGGIAVLGKSLHRIRHAGNLPQYAAWVRRNYLLRLLQNLFTTQAGRAGQVETDPYRLMEETDRLLLQLRDTLQAGAPLRSLHQLAAEAIATHRERQNQKVSDFAICTGFRDLDSLLGGLQAGELCILAGRPGDGKTAIVLQIALNVAKARKKVIFFSLEMVGMQLVNRLFAGEGGIRPHALRISDLTPGELAAMEEIAAGWEDHPLMIDYTPGLTVENLRAQVLLMKKREGCDLVVLDYLHLLDYKTSRGQTMDQVVGDQVKMLKQLAQEVGCPVLVLSQMNRQSENRAERQYRPQLNDLRDSGVIEQAADVVFFVYRPDRYGIEKDEETGESLVNVCQLIVRKNRHGRIHTVNLIHNGSFSGFKDV